jgi:hypothetical protein
MRSNCSSEAMPRWPRASAFRYRAGLSGIIEQLPAFFFGPGKCTETGAPDQVRRLTHRIGKVIGPFVGPFIGQLVDIGIGL